MANILVKTYGCSLNQSDSEAIAGLLAKEGHNVTDNLGKADVVIVNTCTVKGPTITKFEKFLRDVKKENKKAKVIIAGCIPQSEDPLSLSEKYKDYSVLGVFQLMKICEVVEEALNGNKVYLLGRSKDRRLNLPLVKKNEVIEIVPICSGCLGDCTYCKTRQARGVLFSYDKEEILKQIKNSDAKEIWLTAQDTGAYGQDIKTNFIELIDDILKIKRDFKVRLGMCNPNFAKRYIKGFVKILKHSKMFKFVHLPVQSGNDRILKLMNRRYKRKDFIYVVKKLQREVPGITVSTDIIVGFPSETEKEFEDSVSLLKEARINVLNLSRFWPMQGTKAASMEDQIKGDVSKNRSKKLLEAFDKIALEENKKLIGSEREVLIDEEGKNNTFMGRDNFYKPVIVAKKSLKIGDVVKVKIKSATKHDLRT